MDRCFELGVYNVLLVQFNQLINLLAPKRSKGLLRGRHADAKPILLLFS